MAIGPLHHEEAVANFGGGAKVGHGTFPLNKPDTAAAAVGPS